MRPAGAMETMPGSFIGFFSSSEASGIAELPRKVGVPILRLDCMSRLSMFVGVARTPGSQLVIVRTTSGPSAPTLFRGTLMGGDVTVVVTVVPDVGTVTGAAMAPLPLESISGCADWGRGTVSSASLVFARTVLRILREPLANISRRLEFVGVARPLSSTAAAVCTASVPSCATGTARRCVGVAPVRGAVCGRWMCMAVCKVATFGVLAALPWNAAVPVCML
mmetsp:Transcript_37193/g.104967  ORF Transcript_37193/g.104967 Transcript_37193/m.104967 type:complete len:222 (-) Transcript_37193:170-835(-)